MAAPVAARQTAQAQRTEARGKAGPMVELKYTEKKKASDPEATILGMTQANVAGWYFFGLALHGAYHSVILAVDKTDISVPKVYWMDQFTNDFTKDVTGKLGKAMTEFKPGYGYAPSQIWQILPAADTLIEIR